MKKMASAKPKPDPNRLVAPERGEEDSLETGLRPKRLSELKRLMPEASSKIARRSLAEDCNMTSTLPCSMML